jgi:hypothetical protein
MDREALKKEAIELIVGVNHNLEASKVLSAHIARGVGGRETSLAITKLQEAQHWLAECLSELDTEA